MSRPIDGDGTCRYSTGSPGFENAPAVAEPPTAPIRPDNRAAPIAATAIRRGIIAAALRNFPRNVIAPTHPNFRLPLKAGESIRQRSETQGQGVIRVSRPRLDVAFG